MDLERVAAVIRPRNPWEAIDLGFGMVRAWWRPVSAAWLATVAPVWCLLFLLLSGKPLVALLLLWWLRPLFDRVPLFVVSRCLFGAPPPRGAVIAELRRLWGSDLWAALTAQRFDLARSFHLPVGQLEGLAGAQRKRRIELLNRIGHSQATWLTFGCFLLELAACLALLEVLGIMAPQPESGLSAAFQAAADGDAPYWLGLVIGAVSFLAFTVLEPFYVAAGFSLYLSRRTRLEGWDVEIAFRRLTGRLAGRGAGRSAAALLLALFSFLAAPGAVRAIGPMEAMGSTDPDPAQTIHQILAGPDFHTREKVTSWKRRQPEEKRKKETAEPEAPPAPRSRGAQNSSRDVPSFSLPAGFAGLAGFAVAAAILAVLAVLSVGAWRDWRRRVRLPGEEDGKTPLPQAVFGLDIRPESLPADVPAAAWAAWESGDPAAALALLYRGALACLVHRDGLEIAPSWTEGDCLAAVRRRGARESTDYLARLTAAWQSTAYAHRPPSREEAQALCAGWSRCFRTLPETAEAAAA
jgi:hypothetical protein